MKKRSALFPLAGFLCCCFCGCSNPPEKAVLNRKPEGRVLIVCYSESGNKNTLAAAKMLHRLTGGDLREIEMVKPYGRSYSAVLKESKEHLDRKILPPIKPVDAKAADYDTIFVGSPVWYGTYAPPLGSYLAANDFNGKTVIPFCTHGGGGAGHLYEDLAKALPTARILPGLTIRGSNVVERTFGRGTVDKVTPDELIRILNESLK